MFRKFAYLTVLGVILAACDSDDASTATGINTLGTDSVRAFSQDRSGTPIDASGLNLTLTPTADPFNS